MKNKLISLIEQSDNLIIAGHVRPDGDCIGACLALASFIHSQFPNIELEIYLEEIPKIYHYLEGLQWVTTRPKHKSYDLFIALDCGDKGRLGDAAWFFDHAAITINVDHHISNTQYAEINYVKEVSSTCEIIYELLDKELLTQQIAEALYTGIIYDTGIFKHSSTTKQTHVIAGDLIEYDFDFSKIIDTIFHEKTYTQNKLLGKALLNSQLALEGKCIYTYISKEEVAALHTMADDTEGIIDQLRVTQGVYCAFFLYEIEDNEYKVSLRANDVVDVCAIAQHYNGGGHTKASGCHIKGELETIIKDIINLIKQQLS